MDTEHFHTFILQAAVCFVEGGGGYFTMSAIPFPEV